MREPRLIKNPNSNGLLSVDVTLLRLGLSRCRSMAEDAIVRLQNNDVVDVELVLEEICSEARRTLYEIENEEMCDEVGAILAQT